MQLTYFQQILKMRKAALHWYSEFIEIESNGFINSRRKMLIK